MTGINLKEFIRDVPDFPKPGILFRDITPLLSDHRAFQASIDGFVERYADQAIDCVVAAESRGFIFGAPLALRLNAAFVPIRKPGKLPFDKKSQSYELEYGTDTLEIHSDALRPGQRVLIIDDLLATGGTVAACIKLLESFSVEIVECAFAINLTLLNGQQLLSPHKTYSLMEY